MEDSASLDSGVKGVGVAGRLQCPDCLPLPQSQKHRGVAVTLCAGASGHVPPAQPSPAQGDDMPFSGLSFVSCLVGFGRGSGGVPLSFRGTVL